MSLVFSPIGASAQDDAGISGAVTDAQGLALPGVTVTAESPQLIEQNRTVFADGSGSTDSWPFHREPTQSVFSCKDSPH